MEQVISTGVAEDVPLMMHDREAVEENRKVASNKENGGGREINPEAEANQNSMLQASLKEVLGKFFQNQYNIYVHSFFWCYCNMHNV